MSNLPPGVCVRDVPGCDDVPCAVCALDPAECVCPECPVCRTNGDPSCYVDAPDFYGLPAYDPPHGLVRSLGQVMLLAAAAAAADKEMRLDAALSDHLNTLARYADGTWEDPDAPA